MGRFEELGTALDLLFNKIINRNFNKADEMIQKTEQKIDNLKNEVDTIVAHNGDGIKDTELILARGNAPTLGRRLDATDEQLADIVNRRKRTFKDAWTAWQNGGKYPISFFGDSTIDGLSTTGFTPNVIGTDHRPPFAFTSILESLIRAETNNSVLRIYNAGFSGQTASWGYQNIDSIFAGAYADAEMIGIGFGINDSLVADTAIYEEEFRTNIENIILWCYEKNVQPFLLTTQAVFLPGSNNPVGAPLRTGESMNSVANRVKKELAKKYTIELIDVNKYTEMFLQYSQYKLTEIIPDKIHFGDIGHKFEAELFFSHLCPRAIFVGAEETDIVLGFDNQHIKTAVSSDEIVLEDLSNAKNMKSYVYKGKTNTDILIQDFIVFNMNPNNELYLMTLENEADAFSLPATENQKPYVTLNGNKKLLERLFINSYWKNNSRYNSMKIQMLGMGLQNVKLHSGEFNWMSAGGFLISNEARKTQNTSVISWSMDSNGLISKSYASNFFQNYFEEDALFKVEMETNMLPSEEIYLPLVDKNSTLGIALNLANDKAWIVEYTKSYGQDDIVGTVGLTEFYEVAGGGDVKEALKSFYVRVNQNKVSVYLDLKQSPIITTTFSSELGAGYFCNILWAALSNNEFVLIKTTRLS